MLRVDVDVDVDINNDPKAYVFALFVRLISTAYTVQRCAAGKLSIFKGTPQGTVCAAFSRCMPITIAETVVPEY